MKTATSFVINWDAILSIVLTLVVIAAFIIIATHAPNAPIQVAVNWDSAAPVFHGF